MSKAFKGGVLFSPGENGSGPSLCGERESTKTNITFVHEAMRVQIPGAADKRGSYNYPCLSPCIWQ